MMLPAQKRGGGNPSTFLLGKKQDFSFRKVSVEGLNKVAGPMVMQGYAQISSYVILYYSTKSKQDNAKRKSNLAPHNHLLCLPYAIYWYLLTLSFLNLGTNNTQVG